MLRIDILSLFPQITEAALGESIMKRAQEAELVQIRSHNLRNWCFDKHRTADDMPYGGGQGMVLKCEPIFAAIEELRTPEARIVYLSPGGRRLSHAVAVEYAESYPHLILLCGHYEGIDQRIIDHLVHEEISLGDFVLTNGAIAATIFVDCVVRLIPGVLGHAQSAVEESFTTGLLEGPQYTRPVEFRGHRVPDVLLSGNHALIAEWRHEQAVAKTRKVRPDLLGD